MDTAQIFNSIIIIFNPHSTGNAPKLAEQLSGRLAKVLPREVQVNLQPTQHAGHAVELAREGAAKPGKVLIVSVSGDGGYNEVVNGVMQSGNPAAVCAVVAAGNANDHHASVNTKPLDQAIAEGQVRQIDLLHITTEHGDDYTDEYAHSYIGFGLSPAVAIDLEKGSKGALKEMFSVVRTFWKFRPFDMRHADGRHLKVDSLVFANIPEMAKYASLSDADEQPRDGKFEVVLLPHMPKWRMLLTAARAAIRGLGDQPSTDSYEFTTIDSTPYQIDGEVRSVPANTVIRVDSAARRLSIIG